VRGAAIAACAAAVFVVALSPAVAVAQSAGAVRDGKAAGAVSQPLQYTSRDGTYVMPYPALGVSVDMRETMVNERVGWVEFRSGDGAALYVVSTRLVEGPRDARELEAVRRRYADFSRQLPEQFREWSGKGRFGPAYGFTLFNAEPVTGYPVKLGYRGAATPESAAVHRFFVQNGVLYEVAALVQKRGAPAELTPAQLEQRAQGLVDATLAAIEPRKPAATKPPEKR
jgi:hypothetical protein